MKKILVFTDNFELLSRFQDEVELTIEGNFTIEYGISHTNLQLHGLLGFSLDVRLLNLAIDANELIAQFDVILSLHCKQLFPEALVKNVKCIHIHPGLNPYNRGWYPQVFSIINGFPCGATIHFMDSRLDHGAIICQREVIINSWDTSLTVYKRILDLEVGLLKDHLGSILDGNYSRMIPDEGNLNLKKDFNQVCKLDLSNNATLQSHFDLLRALTHGDYLNAFYLDKMGNKVFVKVEFFCED